MNFRAYAHLDNNDEKWLAYRLQLGELTAFASLKNQTLKDFKVVVVLNNRTPVSFQDQLRETLNGLDYIIHLTDTLASELASELCEVARLDAGDRADFIQTTRLDSDDMLHPEYFSRIEQYIQNNLEISDLKEAQYLCYPFGQKFVTSSLEYVAYDYPKNAFGTLLEKNTTSTRSVVCVDHTRMIKSFPTHILHPDEAMWCMIIHGGNLLNNKEGEALEAPGFLVHPELPRFAANPPVYPPRRCEST